MYDMRRTSAVALSLSLSLCLLAACGGSGGDTSDEIVNGEDLVAADDEIVNGEDLATADETSTSAAASETPASTGGTCSVTMTGASPASFTGIGGIAAVNTAHWFTAEELEAAKTDFGFDTPDLVLNCEGEGGNMVTLAKDPASGFPFAPGDVTFETDEISASLNGGIDAYVKPAGPVTVTISVFDESRIAGSATFDAVDVLADSGDVTNVALTFDFDNPNP
jgi:hypothetical protein